MRLGVAAAAGVGPIHQLARQMNSRLTTKMSRRRLHEISNFCRKGDPRAGGWLSRGIACYMLATESADGARENILSSSHRLSLAGTPTFTANAGYTRGDTTQTFTGNGSTTDFSLGFAPANFTVFLNNVEYSSSNYSLVGNSVHFNSAPGNGVAIRVEIEGTGALTVFSNVSSAVTGAGGSKDDISFYIFVLTDNPSTAYDAGATQTGNVMSIRARSGVKMSINAVATAADNYPSIGSLVNTEGFKGFSRDNSANYRARASAGYETITRASSALVTNSLSLLRVGNGSTYSPNQIAFAWVGRSLTLAQENSLRQAVVDYLIGIDTIETDSAEFDAPQVSPHAFARAEINSVSPSMIVSQQINPPSDAYGVNDWAYFPASRYTTQRIDLAYTTNPTGSDFDHWMWVDRFDNAGATGTTLNRRESHIAGTRGGLLINSAGQDCRTSKSSLAKAMCAERVRFMWSCGYSEADIAAEAIAGGFAAVVPFTDPATSDVLTYATIAGKRDDSSFFNLTSEYNASWRVAQDKIYLSSRKLSELRAQNPSRRLGMLIDAEHQDGRTASQQLAHMQDLAEICYNAPSGPFEFTIYTNPLIAPTQAVTGFNDATTIQTLHADPRVTFISIMITAGYTSATVTDELNDQLALFGSSPDMSKIMLIVGLGSSGNELNSARRTEVRNWIETNRPGQFNIFRYYASMGGLRSRTPNQIIAQMLGLSLT